MIEPISTFLQQSAPTAPSYDQYRSRRFFQSLDGLRCLCIVAVVWHHTLGESAGMSVFRRGYLGVDMFFVLSGFLIVTLLLREQDKSGDISLKRFYLRRSLRIFPLYYGLLALFAFVLLFVKPTAAMAQPFFAELPFYLTYTSNWIEVGTIFAIAWSLATEEQFYLLWPPVEKYLKRSTIIALLFGIIVVNQLINFRLLDAPLHALFGIQYEELDILQITFTPICLGALLAHVLHSELGFQRLSRWLQPVWMSGFLLVATFLVCSITEDGLLPGWQRVLIQILMTLLLASCVIREDHGLNRVFKFPPVRRIGVISYGMYLLHMIARHGAESILKITGLHFSFALFLLSLALTIAMSEVSFRFYEQPFLKLKHRFESDR